MYINNHTFNPLEIHTLEMKLSIMLCKKYLEQGCGLLKSLMLGRTRVQPLHSCLSTLAKAKCLLDPLSQSGTADNISPASCFLMRQRLPTHTFLKPPCFSVIDLIPNDNHLLYFFLFPVSLCKLTSACVQRCERVLFSQLEGVPLLGVPLLVAPLPDY